MKLLLPYFKKYAKDTLLSTIMVIITGLSTLYQPRILENIQKAFMADQGHNVMNEVILLIAMAVVAIVAGILMVFFTSRLAQNITSDLRERTYRKIQSFSFANIEYFSTGSLTTRLINDMNQITNLIMNLFLQLLRMPILIFGSIIFSIITIPRYWWATLLMATLLTSLGTSVLKKMDAIFEKFQVKMDDISTQAKETLQGVRVVKSFNQEDQEIKKFNQTSDQLNVYNLQIGYWFSTIMPGLLLIGYLIIALVIYLIGTSIKAHPSDVAVISPYLNYILTLLFCSINLGAVSMTFTRGNVSLKRIQEVLDTKPDVVFNDKAPKTKLAGSIEFDDVSFTYQGNDEPTLEHISFKAEPGQQIGIVGATGSGKSTLAQLIARIYDPTTGKIKIGGSDLREVSEEALRKTVSFVLQKAILFSGTIKTNLQQGKNEATNYELERAAQMAQAQEFIQRYPDNFDHEVEERSANLSGGQKQRLSIARGLISGAPILILDDSTSALDAESEAKVQQALEKELKDTTTVIIAEKIVSVMHADKILVLDDGKLVAQGTHEELLASSPIYQEIYQTQRAKEKRGEF
ncbi:ABC transporter ATP-binding protein [Lactobacillus gigeriorum]|uniref:ABC transporter, ATP-binding / permease protein n=1 Tax=Lactobacillus gigeriorum DSM 23908 = CRBIP 24.85 TaxID=1423751 RepID=I7J2M6_9LACO|nr:ABC transporter ATP-binding protein [Lactobacillus gigeriorum]KRN11881.1 ABC transporter, ATP-binding permease [Lactobacillus gigeriorum DSM 23908 = CRBIP 24.85]CCI86942.1 ABC transporter, ATP-binding / permease protein [Lactobacillus gigeriorum DSM 23908 = CRBIP 24.85]